MGEGRLSPNEKITEPRSVLARMPAKGGGFGPKLVEVNGSRKRRKAERRIAEQLLARMGLEMVLKLFCCLREGVVKRRGNCTEAGNQCGRGNQLPEAAEWEAGGIGERG